MEGLGGETDGPRLPPVVAKTPGNEATRNRADANCARLGDNAITDPRHVAKGLQTG